MLTRSPVILGIPWLVGAPWHPPPSRTVFPACRCLHMRVCVCVCVCVCAHAPACLCFLIRPLVTGLGPVLLQYDLTLTNYICKDPISKCPHTLRFQVDRNWRRRREYYLTQSSRLCDHRNCIRDTDKSLCSISELSHCS